VGYEVGSGVFIGTIHNERVERLFVDPAAGGLGIATGLYLDAEIFQNAAQHLHGFGIPAH
jgi:hypothetical protein